MNALENALQVLDLPPAALVVVATQAAVPPRLARRARAGKPVNAGAYLALCGVVGIDPVDGASRPVKILSANVEWRLLSSALHIKRGLRGLNQRAAAKLIEVSPSTVCRVETGKPVSIANLIKICAFIGVHPDGYTAPLDDPCTMRSRETASETRCSALEISDDLTSLSEQHRRMAFRRIT